MNALGCTSAFNDLLGPAGLCKWLFPFLEIWVHLFAEHDSRVLLLLHQHHFKSLQQPYIHHYPRINSRSIARTRQNSYHFFIAALPRHHIPTIVRARLFSSYFIHWHEKASATRFSKFGSHHHVSERLLKGVPW